MIVAASSAIAVQQNPVTFGELPELRMRTTGIPFAHSKFLDRALPVLLADERLVGVAEPLR